MSASTATAAGAPSSPTSSITSADEALLELLGIETKPGAFRLLCEDSHDDDDRSITEEKQQPAPTIRVPVPVQHLTPPTSCVRPNTPHSAFLLHAPYQLTKPQCQYIIQVANQASNNGGKNYGPAYITEAAPSNSDFSSNQQDCPHNNKVKLQNPNHHKVCVFNNTTIYKWLENVILQHESPLRTAIDKWCLRDNSLFKTESTRLQLNPRLRVLRYDATDDDIFLPHYDATTTTTNTDCCWESKLTVLLYLNTGSGQDFHGGATLFLNAITASTNPLRVEPTIGSFVIFNHELYHASEALAKTETAGTKFILRTDVMLPAHHVGVSIDSKVVQAKDTHDPIIHDDDDDDDSIIMPPTVHQILHHDEINRYSAESIKRLSKVLEELDIVTCASLPPGGVAMLQDLGVPFNLATDFYKACRKHL